MSTSRGTPAPVREAPPPEWDFGGVVVPVAAAPDIGALPTKGGFILGSRAQAATLDSLGIGSCDRDKPRISYAVKDLRNGQPLPEPTSAFLPGLYGGVWTDTVNGHLVSLTRVAVLRTTAQPATPPDLVLYRDFAAHPDPKKRPDLSIRSQVNVYRGQKALLYRVFAVGAGNLRCIDLVLPPDGGFQARPSKIYYDKSSLEYSANFAPVAPHQQ